MTRVPGPPREVPGVDTLTGWTGMRHTLAMAVRGQWMAVQRNPRTRVTFAVLVVLAAVLVWLQPWWSIGVVLAAVAATSYLMWLRPGQRVYAIRNDDGEAILILGLAPRVMHRRAWVVVTHVQLLAPGFDRNATGAVTPASRLRRALSDALAEMGDAQGITLLASAATERLAAAYCRDVAGLEIVGGPDARGAVSVIRRPASATAGVRLRETPPRVKRD